MANFDKKDSAKRRAVQKLEIQRKFFKALIQNQSLPQKLRYEYILKLHALPKKSSTTQVVQKCVFSGRSRGGVAVPRSREHSGWRSRRQSAQRSGCGSPGDLERLRVRG